MVLYGLVRPSVLCQSCRTERTTIFVRFHPRVQWLSSRSISQCSQFYTIFTFSHLYNLLIYSIISIIWCAIKSLSYHIAFTAQSTSPLQGDGCSEGSEFRVIPGALQPWLQTDGPWQCLTIFVLFVSPCPLFSTFSAAQPSSFSSILRIWHENLQWSLGHQEFLWVLAIAACVPSAYIACSTLPDDVMKCVHLQYDASLCFAKLMIQPVNSRQATHAHTCSKHHELMHICEVDCSRFGQAELCNQTQIELGFKNGSCYGVYIIPIMS